jgi:hypothetical protein
VTDPQNPSDPTPPPPAPQGPPSYNAPPPAQPYGQQPYAAAPPAAYGQPANAPIPGRTLGIVAFVLSFFTGLIALILGIVALVQSKKAGVSNGWAVAAIIISSVFTVIGIIVGIFAIIALAAGAGFASELLAACQAVDFTGTVTVQGQTVDCSTLNR